MVNTRHTIGRRRSLIEHKRGVPLSRFQTLMEDVSLLPSLQYLFIDRRQIEGSIFGKFLAHILFY